MSACWVMFQTSLLTIIPHQAPCRTKGPVGAGPDRAPFLRHIFKLSSRTEKKLLDRRECTSQFPENYAWLPKVGWKQLLSINISSHGDEGVNTSILHIRHIVRVFRLLHHQHGGRSASASTNATNRSSHLPKVMYHQNTLLLDHVGGSALVDAGISWGTRYPCPRPRSKDTSVMRIRCHTVITEV